MRVELGRIARAADDDAGAETEAIEDFCECDGVAAGANVGALAEEAIAFPFELAAQWGALWIGELTCDDQGPVTVPVELRRGVDLLVGSLETQAAGWSEGIEAAAALAMGFEPSILHEAKDAGADEAFGDAKGCEEIDQLS